MYADMTFPINKAETAELIRHRKLVKTPPLYRLLHMQVPEEICRQIEETAGGIDSYLMGLVSKGRIVGDVGISLQKWFRTAEPGTDRGVHQDGRDRNRPENC